MTMLVKRGILYLTVAVLVTAAACSRDQLPAQPSDRAKSLPPIILWAWERPEDLEFIDPERFGVAFLAQTLVMNEDDVLAQPRRQPLDVPSGTKLIAVTRIESRKHSGSRVSLSDTQQARLIELILRTLDLPGVSGVQIDFDVVVSEREFYRSLLSELRSKLPDEIPLSITALASFCLGDRWMTGLEVDEAVPMFFRMGDGRDSIREHLRSGGDLREPLCCTSYGISLDEPMDMKFDSVRRIYIFNPRPWKKDDLNRIEEIIR